MSIFKQPLIHFLLLGFLVFVVFEWRTGAVVSSSEASNMVSHDSFIEFIQYRHSGLDQVSAQQLVKNMPIVQKKNLLMQHIKEEVLYREALTLGLNDKDYVIKQRLIQKMKYLLDDAEPSKNHLKSYAVADYFERNKQRYLVPATVTFAQVFIDTSRHSQTEAQQLANSLKGQLKRDQAPFENASRYGERFVYFTNYVDRDKSFVASHFGQAFANRIFSSAVSARWQGPIQSDYGVHLVLITQLQAGGVPELAAVYSKVAQNLQRELLAEQLEINIQALIENYNIDVAALESKL